MNIDPHHDHATAQTPGAVQDPVCRHWILPERAAARSRRGDHWVHFCRLACQRVYDRDPDRFPLATAT